MRKRSKHFDDRDIKIYHPSGVVPINETYVVTDNVSVRGKIKNRSEENAALARKWLDENEK